MSLVNSMRGLYRRSATHRKGRQPLPTRSRRPRRLGVEALEDRTLPSIDVLSSFAGLAWPDSEARRPPDTIAAAGPNHLVEMVNAEIAFYDKTTGTKLFQQTLADFFGPVTNPDPRAGDPVVAYDELAQRFFVGVLDFSHVPTGLQESFFYFAVSNSANPLDGFSEMHKIDTKRIFEGIPTVADFPRIGWNADAYVFTFRMYRFPFQAGIFSHNQVLTIDKAAVLDADPATLTKYHVDLPAPNEAAVLATATMHGAAPGDPMWFVRSDANSASTLTVLRMTNVLCETPTFATYSIPVPSYNAPPLMTQPGVGLLAVPGSSRLTNAAWRDDRLLAAQAVEADGVARARWYEFDTRDPNRPTLAQTGEINQGPRVNTSYPAIDIAPNGDLGLTFMQSSASEFLSMYVTGRTPTDPLGVMRPPTLVKAGEATFDALDPSPHDKSGDYAGLTVDPVTGTFWAAHEYATAATTLTNWGTWFAQFALAEPAGAWVTASSPGPVVVAPSVQSLTFTFSEPMDTSSFALAADVVRFTGPGGVDLRTQLLVWGSFGWSPDGRVLTVNFPAQSAFGLYTLVLGPQILRASDGQPLDQNGNGLAGEVPGDQYAAGFTLNCTRPDGFGYTACLHPFEAVQLVPGAPGVFSILENTDNGVARVDLGANTFTFYGTVYQSLFVSSNGLITFGTGNSVAANASLFFSPNQRGIAPLWDDWQTGPDGVLYQFEDTTGDGTPDRLILQWHEVRHAPTSPGAVTFQAILSLNTGVNTSDIVFNYPQLDTGDVTAEGASATVGIKDLSAQGANYARISFDRLSPFVGSGKAIRFTAPPVGGEIHGQAFHDVNRNGVPDADEPGLADWTVYLDLNGNGLRDSSEPFTRTDAGGHYLFTDVVPGSYTVRVEGQPGWVRSVASGSRILQNFEDGRMGAYRTVGGNLGSAELSGTGRPWFEPAAHDGVWGLRDRPGNDWIFRNDAAVQVAQGDTLSVWLRLVNVANGRAHFGFGATPSGTLSLVVAADTNQLLLQENLGYDAAGPVLGAVPQAYLPNQWHRLEVVWGTDGTLIGRLYDSDGVTLLNTVMGSSSVITAGGIAFRATGGQKYWDTVTATSGGGDGLTLYVGPRQAVVGKDFGFSLDAVATVEAVVVNDGSAQRSRVTSLTITFSSEVALDPGAFELLRQDGSPVNLDVATAVAAGRTVAVLTFTGAGIVGGSLADGNYTLIIHGDRIHDGHGFNLDGDGDGLLGGDRLEAFFRLYGDSDGDRDVDLLDLGRFLSTFGRRAGHPRFLEHLDYNGDGRVNLTDLFAFADRLGADLQP